VESTLTVQSWPSASSHPARSLSRIRSQVPSIDQRRCVVDGLPVPVARRQIAPGDVRSDPEEHTIDHHPVVGPPPTLPRIDREGWQQPLPLLIGQVVIIQAMFHMTDLHQTTIEDPRDTP
jgi:hypothetical protein